MMSWARSFYGLYLDDAVLVAEKVLDEIFGGDISDADPKEVIDQYDKMVFKLNSSGVVILSEKSTPTWEDHGFVRPPEGFPENKNYWFSISDNTLIDAVSFAQTRIETNVVKQYEENFAGVKDDGSLVLLSGGEVPPLSDDVRAVVWPTIFSNPTAITQEQIDDLVANPPESFEPQNFVEEKSLEVYEYMVESAIRLVDEFNNNTNRTFDHVH